MAVSDRTRFVSKLPETLREPFALAFGTDDTPAPLTPAAIDAAVARAGATSPLRCALSLLSDSSRAVCDIEQSRDMAVTYSTLLHEFDDAATVHNAAALAIAHARACLESEIRGRPDAIDVLEAGAQVAASVRTSLAGGER